MDTHKPITKYNKFLILILLMTASGCNNLTTCKPYFIYDKVEHYYYDISEDEISTIMQKDKKTSKENKQIELLAQYTPNKLADTAILKNMDKIGFVKKNLAKKKFAILDQIFCERKHSERVEMSCIAIYRDILVFKKNNRIVGSAKICFDCGDKIITGATRNTDDFGQSGDYGKLYKLLH